MNNEMTMLVSKAACAFAALVLAAVVVEPVDHPEAEDAGPTAMMERFAAEHGVELADDAKPQPDDEPVQPRPQGVTWNRDIPNCPVCIEVLGLGGPASPVIVTRPSPSVVRVDGATYARIYPLARVITGHPIDLADMAASHCGNSLIEWEVDPTKDYRLSVAVVDFTGPQPSPAVVTEHPVPWDRIDRLATAIRLELQSKAIRDGMDPQPTFLEWAEAVARLNWEGQSGPQN